MLSRENKPLTAIGKKRADWYVSRNLAEEVANPETTSLYPKFERIIRLNFKAKMEERTDPFYLEVKETQCVVCGSRDALSLHHVIPSVIRKHFPEDDKKHSHSWCVLLCPKHHSLADALALELHQQSLKDLDESIRLYVANAREAWGQDFIKSQGGIEKVKQLYREKFLETTPAHLPEGFLEDHKVEKLVLTFPTESQQSAPVN